MKPTPTRDAMKLFHEGTLAFAEMESNGVRIDTELLDQRLGETESLVRTLTEELKADPLWERWQTKYRKKAKLGSLVQLSELLFEDMGYPCHEKTHTGLPKADDKALLATGLPFCAKYVRAKKLEKTAGTFLKGIKKFVSPDGRLRPSYCLHTATSYRSSCKDPNAQNFPKRNPEMAALVRPCFVPSRGRRLVEVDYAGIEVRVSACYNKDPVLIKYITDPATDMHRDTACELFLLPKELVDKKTTRDWSKNRFVFPQFYGSVYFQCAPHLWEAVVESDDKGYKHKLPTGEAVYDHLKSRGYASLGDCDPAKSPLPGTYEFLVKKVESSFWNDRFKVYTRWKKDWFNDYVRKGYSESLTGFVYEWAGGDEEDKAGGGRLPSRNDILNYSIQGSSFHCMLWSLIQITKWLRANKMETLVVGQIHDSVLLDVPETELQYVLSHLNVLMTKTLAEHWRWIIVPMAVEFEVSEIDGNWHQQLVYVSSSGGVWKPK